MTDLISRADAMAEFREYVKRANENGETPTWNDAVSLIGSLPSADAVQVTGKLKSVEISTDKGDESTMSQPNGKLESADAVHIHNDGTLEVKVPNAQKVGRVLVMDTDSHIGGGLFYPDDAEQTDKLENQPCLVERNYTTEGGGREIYHPTRQQGKWLPIEETLPTYDGGEKTWLTGMKCSNCGKLFDLRVGYYFCPSCGSRMENKK